jgi:hypothetical protein
MATFSEIDITFTDALISDSNTSGFNLSILNVSTNVFFKLREIIVTTRSAANEFTQGSDAATQAQFYKDAIDLDFVPGGEYEATIAGAVVTIKSTVDTYQFQSVITGSANLPKFSTVIRNYSIPAAATGGIMLARSNYYLTTPITTESNIDVKMYFRQGNLTDALGVPNYNKKVLRPSTNWEHFDVLISRFALDFLNPKPVYQTTNGVLSSTAGSVIGTTITTSTNLSVTPAERLANLITTRGFSSYSDNATYLETASEVLLTSINNQVLKNGVIMIPYINDGSLTDIEIKNDANTILFTHTLTEAANVETKIQYLFFNTNGLVSSYFSVNDTIIFEVVEECKFTPQDILFLNKFGVFESFTFYKAKENKVDFSQEGEFKNNSVFGGAYDITKHLYKSGNKNARETITLNTGYINEKQNEVLRGVLNSEYVFFNNAGTFVPVNVDTKSLSILSKINDKLINYTIDFKESFDTVQNV